MQAIFRMGIPVTGKNVFPSNIQGLPTWYEVRVNRDGYTARTPDFDLLVAMNPATYDRDIEEVRSGGYLLYDSSWPMDKARMRDDVTFLGVPLGKMCVEAFKGARERILMKNIAYAGALAAFVSMDMDVIRSMLEEKFSRKPALIDSNFKAIELGYDYAKEHFACPLPIRLESMDATADHILIDGNTSAGLGCVYAGATVGAWYPITPSTSLMDGFSAFCERFRKDPETGKKGDSSSFRAEDETGGGWRGRRRGLGGSARLHAYQRPRHLAHERVHRPRVLRRDPIRIRGRPAGRTVHGNADAYAAGRSHDDRVTPRTAIRSISRYFLPIRPSPFYFAIEAFDLAERFQTPVFPRSGPRHRHERTG